MLQNSIFVGFKPPNCTSNEFANAIKKRFKLAKIGYSGTLDPFAKGALLMASGAYTRLLSHIETSPKTYIATLWLGADSKSLDITNISRVECVREVRESEILRALDSLIGRIIYTPPIFSAKKIHGTRAYKLARAGENIELKETKMDVFSLELLHYSHPFLHFKTSVSKGAYVRSLGDLIAKKLGTFGALSSLERISEGRFIFENYKAISPLDALNYSCVRLDSYKNDFECGKKIALSQNDAQIKMAKNTRYIALFDEFFSIIELNNEGEVAYIANKIPKGFEC